MIKDSQEEGFCQTCLSGHLFRHNESRTLAPRGTLALAGSAREASVAIPEGTPWPGQGIRDGVAGSTGKGPV
jgi:hypothetical protein